MSATIKFKESKYNIVQRLEPGKLLLFNTYSEAMVTVNDEYYENNIVKCLPCEDQIRLYDMGLIVNADLDETFRVQCSNRTVKYNGDKKISNIKVMVTSACNARCWYCFEKGIHPKNMNAETADALISFIIKYGDKDKLHIAWFGGEPTLKLDIIQRISDALLYNGFKLSCSIVTNGYLLDETFIQSMLKYGLDHVQITIDGLNDQYNSIKNYKGNPENPFDQVMQNIHTAAQYDFHTSIRLNYNSDNVEELCRVIDYLHDKFNNKIGVYVAPIIGDDVELSTVGKNYLVLFDKLMQCGYITKLSQAHLQSIPVFCGAEILNYYTVSPDGYLYKCSQEVSYPDGMRSVGDIFNGPMMNQTLKEWMDAQDVDECTDCKLLPLCQQGCRGARLNVKGLTYSCIPTRDIINNIIMRMYYFKKNNH